MMATESGNRVAAIAEIFTLLRLGTILTFPINDAPGAIAANRQRIPFFLAEKIARESLETWLFAVEYQPRVLLHPECRIRHLYGSERCLKGE